MGIFERFRNPAWSHIRRLSAEDQRVLCFALTWSTNLVSKIEQSMIAQFERMLSRLDRPEWRRGNERITPFPEETRIMLAREATVGLLQCAPIDANAPSGLGRFHSQEVIQLIGKLVVAVHQASMPSVSYSTLDDSGYSTSRDEARTQCLVRWMDILGLEDARFVLIVNQTPFAEDWNNCAAAIPAAMFSPADHASREAAIERAKEVCRTLPTTVVALIEEWSQTARRQERARG